MPTSLASLVADVMLLTNRPSLAGETALAVQAATLKAHHSDDYIKDFTEYSIVFGSSEYYQSIDYKLMIPLWRKPRYIRKYDNTPGLQGPGVFLKYMEPESAVDSYGYSREDVFYVAGANLQIRSSTPLLYALIGVYNNPDITSGGYDSWIADDHKFAIIYEATAIIFKTTGFDEQERSYRLMVAEQYQILKQQAVTGLGM